MADPRSDAEQMRMKRVARLQQVPSQPPKPPLADASNPFAVVMAPSVRQESRQAAPAGPSAEHFWIQDVLQVNLSVATDGDSLLVTLAELADELAQEGVSLLTRDLVDRVLVARLSMTENADENFGWRRACCSGDHGTAPLAAEDASLYQYLYLAWSRAHKLAGSDNIVGDLAERKAAVIAQVKELCVSYAGILLKYPDTFPQPQRVCDLGATVLIPQLLQVASEMYDAASLDFIAELVARFVDDGLGEIFDSVLNKLSAMARAKTLMTDYLPVLKAVNFLVTFKPVAMLVTKLASFNPPNMPPRSMESASFFGPFFRLTVLASDGDAELATAHFGQMFRRSRSDVDSATRSLRMMLGNLQQILFQTILLVIKSSPESRDAVLQYFATVLDRNGNRAKMHIQDPSSVSTDGFMYNIYAVMLKLCDPLMDPGFSKLHLIDSEYLLGPAVRFTTANLTKLNTTASEDSVNNSPEANVQVEKAPNFVTEVFFLTAMFHHFAAHRTILTYMDMLRNIKELQQAVDKIKADQPNWITSPRAAAYQQVLKRYEEQLDQMVTYKLSFDVQLLDPAMTVHILQFQQLMVRFLLKQATLPCALKGSASGAMDYCKGPTFRLPANVQLPLECEPQKCFRHYPEFFIEDITEFFMHITRFDPDSLVASGGSSFLDEIMSFSIVFLISKAGAQAATTDDNPASSFIKNPYLISKLVEVLFSFTWNYGRGSQFQSACRNMFAIHPLAVKYLPMGLIGFWVDVEKTGLSNQFYEKFGIRYNISQVLKLLWNDYPPALYRERIRQESVERWSTFVKFVNLLMNDTTYLLDESLGSLTKIHSLQIEMEDEQFASIPEEQRTEKIKLLQDLERRAQSTCQLGAETVNMLQYLTESIIDPFLRPEIIDRLAAMLNYNLVQLVGPTCTELKVKNPVKYGFNPKTLLSNIVDIYLHLAPPSRTEFVCAVARDGRSYASSHFKNAGRILLDKSVKDSASINMLLQFAERCESILASDLSEEQELGDVPDEFLDPLMFTIMLDPVILPGSRQTVDRSTIQSHLLSDLTDPFNRMPLTLDMVIPNEEIKAKIAYWRASKRAV